MANRVRKPRLGIYSLTGCAGDQLQILNMEDELLDLVARFIIVDFQEGSSYKEPGSVDIALVEGTVSTETDLEHLKAIREKAKTLIAIGNCAIEGCIQSMRNGSTSLAEKLKDVYGVEPEYFNALESKPLADYVKVDLKIPGCPIEKDETLRAVIGLLNGDKPQPFTYSVCVECKINEYPCLITEKNLPCLGPIVRAGCNARCPGLGLDCIGCRGPVEGVENFSAEYKMLLDKGFSEEFILNRLRVFSGKLPDGLTGGGSV